MLHRFLGVGLIGLAAVFVVLELRGVAPMLPPDVEARRVIALVLAGLSFAVMAVGLFVVQPKVPRRRTGVSIEQYWSMPQVAQRMFMLWFVLEGAAIVALVGYVMTADRVVGAAAAVAIGMFWLNRPARFSEAGVA
jgi:hypothetical protein